MILSIFEVFLNLHLMLMGKLQLMVIKYIYFHTFLQILTISKITTTKTFFLTFSSIFFSQRKQKKIFLHLYSTLVRIFIFKKLWCKQTKNLQFVSLTEFFFPFFKKVLDSIWTRRRKKHLTSQLFVFKLQQKTTSLILPED
jgi:hypothetical protein